MQDHFLKEIDIIEYKCFKNFNTKNFKRINLISGKNNVGKTVLLESIFINLYSSLSTNMTYAIGLLSLIRDQLEFITKKEEELFDEFKKRLQTSKFNAKSNINNSRFEILNKDGIKEYFFNINGNEQIININKFSHETKSIQNIKFLDNFGTSNKDIKNYFDSIQKKDKENYLNKSITKFDSNIEKFKIIEDKPQCKIVNSDIFRDINEFGDGLKHYISIICALYASENGQLFVDEIDNGIHYTQLERLWEIIFSISKEVNCQVFATTHSKEMINAFEKVSKNLNDRDISFIELGRNKNNDIKSITMDSDRLQREINLGNEIRGW